MSAVLPTSYSSVVQGLDRWFETMRVDWPSPGYGGPVVHWWNHSLAYRGAGFDWRYEGIIDGYLTLWRATGDAYWLNCATRAGDDLVGAQLPNGHYRNSAFELNPATGGTPHEIAADVGLLLLASELRDNDRATADRYLATAQRNLETYAFDRLWHQPTETLRDGLNELSFVPNKAATFIDAVLELSELTAREEFVERYALPTAAKILAMQVGERASQLYGAIAQNRFGDRVIEAYFPLYIARIIPPILKLFVRTGERRLQEAALAAARFLERVREADGGFPQVIYGNGARNRAPRWIGGSGDMLRAFIAANQFGAEIDLNPSIQWLLRGVRADGHIATAEGFGRVMPFISRRDRFAGELGVVGWCDKAFRAFALICAASADGLPENARAEGGKTLTLTV